MKTSFQWERTRPACRARRRAGHSVRAWMARINIAFGAFEPVGATPTGATGTVALPNSN